MPPGIEISAYRKIRQTPLLNGDFSVNGAETIESKYGIRLFDDVNDAFSNLPDLTVISTPTALHRIYLEKAVEAGSSVIVEKPWAQDLRGFQKFKEMIIEKQLSFLISFQRRYHPLIARAKQLLAEETLGNIMSASFTVYSDVRKWHPYEDWRSLYAVNKELGGGVLLTEIHEIDLVCWFFGLPESVFCLGGNTSGESIDVEDTVQMILQYSGFCVQMILSFLQPQSQRNFHISGTKGTIAWSENPNKLVLSTMEKSEVVETPLLTNDMMFIAQNEDFLRFWTPEKTQNNLDAAENSLLVVETAKRSMNSGRVEKIERS